MILRATDSKFSRVVIDAEGKLRREAIEWVNLETGECGIFSRIALGEFFWDPKTGQLVREIIWIPAPGSVIPGVMEGDGNG